MNATVCCIYTHESGLGYRQDKSSQIQTGHSRRKRYILPRVRCLRWCPPEMDGRGKRLTEMRLFYRESTITWEDYSRSIIHVCVEDAHLVCRECFLSACPVIRDLPGRLSNQCRERKPVVIFVFFEVCESDHEETGEGRGIAFGGDALPNLTMFAR